MAVEWPIPKPEADDSQPLLALALPEHVTLVKLSAAVHAFCEQRAVQMLPPFSHTAEADMDRDVDELVRMAAYRLQGYLEIVGRGLRNLPRDRRDTLLRKLDIAGGLLIAARDRAAAIIPEEGE